MSTLVVISPGRPRRGGGQDYTLFISVSPNYVGGGQPLSRQAGFGPYARLSAVKVAGDPSNPARFKDDATADELRAEIMKRIEILTSAGLIDLQALPAPKGGIAQPVFGVDQSGINGE
jgi:hypothetical protein